MVSARQPLALTVVILRKEIVIQYLLFTIHSYNIYIILLSFQMSSDAVIVLHQVRHITYLIEYDLIFICMWNCIRGVMVCMLGSVAVECGFES